MVAVPGVGLAPPTDSEPLPFSESSGWVSVSSSVPSVGSSGVEPSLSHEGALGLEFAEPGVGSKRVQPTPGSQSSGHACASLLLTTRSMPSSANSPEVKPTLIRLGTPSTRAITAIAVAKCSQYPRRSRRKSTIAELPVPPGVRRS